jgi:hypothetical protein
MGKTHMNNNADEHVKCLDSSDVECFPSLQPYYSEHAWSRLERFMELCGGGRSFRRRDLVERS